MQLDSRVRHLLAPWILGVLAFFTAVRSVTAGSDSQINTVTQPDTRYGWFGLLDKRSLYGQGAFPEPFIVDDSDLEVNELRLDWQHNGRISDHSDVFSGEIEKGFGVVTAELRVPYESDLTGGVRTHGFDNIELGIRTPVFQYVSSNGMVDSTFGIGFEAGIPTNSELSKNTELVPKVFNDLRLGDHFTLQSIVGYSALLGPGEQGGQRTLEYGFVFGYAITHQQLPIPDVLQLIPVFELSGETGLAGASKQTSLTGNAAIRVNLKSIGPIQPRLGVGYVFPMNNVARQDLHWGIVTSLVFEY
ncbi:MAG: hypothetical protein JO331_13670 [Verrucomicrobia bacterium]|nr:hypothetical protein [Verrucomicrobiota bacterium]